MRLFTRNILRLGFEVRGDGLYYLHIKKDHANRDYYFIFDGVVIIMEISLMGKHITYLTPVIESTDGIKELYKLFAGKELKEDHV